MRMRDLSRQPADGRSDARSLHRPDGDDYSVPKLGINSIESRMNGRLTADSRRSSAGSSLLFFLFVFKQDCGLQLFCREYWHFHILLKPAGI